MKEKVKETRYVVVNGEIICSFVCSLDPDMPSYKDDPYFVESRRRAMEILESCPIPDYILYGKF